MKKTLLGSIATSLMLLFTAPVYADNVVQIWNCTLNAGKTTADIIALSSAWLKAAKGMEGGEDLDVSLEFPMAANVSDSSFNFVLIAPDAKVWGVFNADYEGSAAADVDATWFETASCSSSSLWNSIDLE
jgi:hypothetical protein